MAAGLEDWPYSNYLEWIGKREGKLVDRTFVGQHFQSGNDYADFVADYLRTRRMPDEGMRYLLEFERRRGDSHLQDDCHLKDSILSSHAAFFI